MVLVPLDLLKETLTMDTNSIWNARQKAVADLRSFEAANPQASMTAADKEVEGRMNDEVIRLDNLMNSAASDAQRSNALDAAVARFDHASGSGVEHRDADEVAWLRSAKPGDQASYSLPLEQRSALLKSNTGGNAVPQRTFSEVVADRIDLGGLLKSGLTVINTASGEEIVVPTTDARPTATLVAEGASIGISDGTLNQTTLKAYKYSLISQASNELIADNSADVVNYIGTIAGDALNLALTAAVTSGTGTDQPEGVMTGTVGKTLASAGAITADEAMDWFYSLPSEERDGGVFYFSDAMALALRKLKATDDQYIWQQGLSADEPDRFLGKPVITGSAAPTFDATASAVVGAFFNPSGTMLRVAGGLGVERSTDFAFQEDLVSWKWRVRADSRIVRPNSIATLVNP